MAGFTIRTLAWPPLHEVFVQECVRPGFQKKIARNSSIIREFRDAVYPLRPSCQWCGRELIKLEVTIDHVVPLGLGGSNRSTNLVLSCDPCNKAKGVDLPNRTPLGPRWVYKVKAKTLRKLMEKQEHPDVGGNEAALKELCGGHGR